MTSQPESAATRAARRRNGAHVAAHELRHDVQVARELLDELLLGSEQDVSGGRAEQLGRALARLERDIDRLLTFSGEDLDAVHREPTNLGQLVEQIVAAHPTGHHPVQVMVAPVILNIDPVKVERIVDNLLANALTHTPRGCPIQVMASAEPGGAMVVVEDEGPGLPDKVRDALLGPGVEPDHSVGMGLWVAVHFARLHGGDVTVAAGPEGRGTRFSVWLPARQP